MVARVSELGLVMGFLEMGRSGVSGWCSAGLRGFVKMEVGDGFYGNGCQGRHGFE